MTPPRARLVLWLALLVAAPVPFFLVVVGWVPVARLVQLLGITLAIIGIEGPAGALRTAAFMFGVQIALWTALLRLIAGLVTAGLYRMLRRRAATAATSTLVATLVVVAALVPIYRTPFRAGSLHATLLQVFE